MIGNKFEHRMSNDFYSEFFPLIKSHVDNLLSHYDSTGFRENPSIDINAIAVDVGIHDILYVRAETISNNRAILMKDGIFLNINDSHEEQRFSIAHELGHFIFSQNDMLIAARAMKDLSPYRTDMLFEEFADYFAANLLVPTELFILWEDKPDEEIAHAFNVSVSCIKKRRGEVKYETSFLLQDEKISTVIYENSIVQPKDILTDIIYVNSELLNDLKTDPSLFYNLSSRKFEEVVAEMLSRLGYEINLTPAARDGGKDIYAAKKEQLGSFLYIVECKKYSPKKRVGINMVRELHGVVQAEKATAGILVTTSFFTKPAKDFRDTIRYQLSLIDYVGLQKWINGIFPMP